jgi:hypothetical protein
LFTQPGEPRARGAQSFEQRHLRHLGDTTGPSLGHRFTQPGVIDCVKEQKPQQWRWISDVSRPLKSLLLSGRLLPAGRQQPFDHSPLVILCGLHASNNSEACQESKLFRLTPMPLTPLFSPTQFHEDPKNKHDPSDGRCYRDDV